MTVQTNDSSSMMVLERIDAIAAELQILRQQVLTIQHSSPPSVNLVDELAGALGTGAWDEYDFQLDWERFSA